MTRATDKKPVVIKKYSNRRLYNTEISTYVTLADLCLMVKKNIDFVVKDAKTDEDLTHLILTQIIFDQELKGYKLLPISFLKQIITFYDDNLRLVLPDYLERTMTHFSSHQNQMRDYMKTMEGLSPINLLSEITKQNQAFFDNMMQLFTPPSPKAKDDDQEQK